MQRTVFAVSVILFLGASPLQAQSLAAASGVMATPPRLSADQRAYYRSHPAAWNTLLEQLRRDQTSDVVQAAGVNPTPDPVQAARAPWVPLANRYPGKSASQPVLLMDGSVIVHEGGCSRDWYRLRPDAYGDYSTGSWSKIARLPDGYAPFAYAAQVLADGRVIIAGGEYNLDCTSLGDNGMSNMAAVYDPNKDSWTQVRPLKDFVIGDSPSIVLADTTLLVGGQDASAGTADLMAKLDPTKMAWTRVSPKTTASTLEVGWTLLPDGKVFTLSTFCERNRSQAYTFDPDKNGWALAGYTPVRLVDCDVEDEESGTSPEVGPNLLLPDGKVVLFGAAASADKGASTVVYDPSSGSFDRGPDIPRKKYMAGDAPAALLPNGDVLFAASPGFYTRPAKFFIYHRRGRSEKDQIMEVWTDASSKANYYALMVLPTGQVLATNGTREIKLFSGATPADAPGWAPSITSTSPAGALEREKEYALSGMRLNGVSEAGAYGDESPTSTNYPIIRLTEKFTKRVYYCRTTRVESRSIAPDAVTTAHFLVPKGVPASGSTYSYQLEVVANGVASRPRNVVIR